MDETLTTALDSRLFPLAVGRDETVTTYSLAPHLSRLDGALYGGAALAMSIAAFELATSRPALWVTVQFVGSARTGELIETTVDRAARGNYIDQVQLAATVDGRLVYSALGSTATRRSDGISGLGRSMPVVPAPEECEGFSPMRADLTNHAVGHHLVSEYREAGQRVSTGSGAGRVLMWARLTDETETTAAKLGFLGDMVPVAICHAAGVVGAGTSLDNAIRVGRLIDTEWVLVELEAHAADGGYGYGVAHMWSPDGVLMATASQTAKLFSIESMLARRALSSDS